jgi:gliding motility-associated-like protein
LTVTDANGCTIAATNIVVIELPGVLMTAIVTNIPCAEVQNGSIDVSATSSFLPLQYQWSTGETTEDLSALNTGTYSVTVTDQHNCTADSTFVVGNNNVFTMDATPSVVTINLGESVNLDVTALTGILSTAVWTPSTGLNCTDCFNPVSSAVESITYFVDGTDVNGCKADDSVRINVIPIYNIFIPNAFTPNGDGFNDFFEVMGNKEAWKQFEVKLFNRWGEKVYESNDMNFKWDGVFKSRMLEPTVLVYTIRLVYLDNYTEKIHKGTVTLIR